MDELKVFTASIEEALRFTDTCTTLSILLKLQDARTSSNVIYITQMGLLATTESEAIAKYWQRQISLGFLGCQDRKRTAMRSQPVQMSAQRRRLGSATSWRSNVDPKGALTTKEERPAPSRKRIHCCFLVLATEQLSLLAHSHFTKVINTPDTGTKFLELWYGGT